MQVFHAPSIQQASQFEFRIRYKFLSRTEAVVRYGPSSELLELGKVTPGTYCTRQFEECYRSKCRLQSPNYPGMVSTKKRRKKIFVLHVFEGKKSIPKRRKETIQIKEEKNLQTFLIISYKKLNNTQHSSLISIHGMSPATGQFAKKWCPHLSMLW